MMQEYKRKRKESVAASNAAGVLLTLTLHVGAILVISFTGIKYIYPPPPETAMLLDFEEEVEMPVVKQKRGRRPEGELVDKEKPVELVQRSESPYTVQKSNVTPETKQDNFGDIDTPAPEQKEEPVLDARAAFPGMAKKDTSVTAPHSASEASTSFKAGHAQGNTDDGATEGRPNAHVEGRNLKGSTLYKPAYKIQKSGCVIVKIWVNQWGDVTKAMAGADGTTLTDSNLWNECRKMALKAKFDFNKDAPTAQEGTITYIFNLK